ncbi:MAG: hypothetical protein WA667_28510 [Candidatus Nitrosopolaris sp.]
MKCFSTEKEFQEFLESIATKVTELERRRGDLHNSVSTAEGKFYSLSLFL